MHSRPGSLVLSLSLLLAAAVLAGPAHAFSNPQAVFEGHDDHGEGGEATPTAAAALSYTPCVDGRADVYSCQDVDLMSFVPLEELGDVRTAGIWGWTDPQTRREYALIALGQRTSFVDITNPAQPRIAGYLPAHTDVLTGNREVNVYGNHAFVVADSAGEHGIQIFDLTRLRSTSGAPVRFSETAWYGEVGKVHTLFINQETGFAYANGSDKCDGGLHMVDVRNPRRPRFAGCFADTREEPSKYIHDVQCVIYRGPDRRFSRREICFASNPRSLQIVDVTDKSAPRLVASATYPEAAYIHQGWLTDDQRYFLMDDEIDEDQQKKNTTTHLWDVSDLTAPVRFATHTGTTRATDHNQFVHDGFLYQGNYRAGLRILDLERVAEGRLTEVAFFDTVPESDEPGFTGVWGVYPFFPSGNLAVSSIDRGLFILRRSGTTAPPAPGPVPAVCRSGPEQLCLLGRYVVDVTWENPFDGSSGAGRAVRSSDLAGYFSFGDPANLELMVKMLDFGGEVRFFYGQLTNFEVSIRVTDTRTGQVTEYGNGRNNCGAIAILPSKGAAAQPLLSPQIFDFAQPGEGISAKADLGGGLRPATGAHEAGTCAPGKDRLCLNHRRFQVEVTWGNQFDGSKGAGRPVALSELTGSFSFQDPRNTELLVKILDFDGRILILWGSLSNFEYAIKVTDTTSGRVNTYFNYAGLYCGGMDPDAFDGF